MTKTFGQFYRGWNRDFEIKDFFMVLECLMRKLKNLASLSPASPTVTTTEQPEVPLNILRRLWMQMPLMRHLSGSHLQYPRELASSTSYGQESLSVSVFSKTKLYFCSKCAALQPSQWEFALLQGNFLRLSAFIGLSVKLWLLLTLTCVILYVLRLPAGIQNCSALT